MAEKGKRRSLTRQEVERIGELRAANLPLRTIATMIGCSPGAASWHCLVNGFEPSKPRELPPLNSDTRPRRRGNHIVRPFTADEDALLLKLESKGLGYSRIGRTLGRQHNSVRGRLATLARHAERNADAR